jgi:YHS domain-containing protein
MKTSIALALAALLLAAAPAAFAAPGHDCCPAPAKPAAAEGVPADYPLDTCVVLGGKLDAMGKPHAHIHKADGQPDRTVYLCCKGCLPAFEKDPAKYLKKLDEAKKK